MASIADRALEAVSKELSLLQMGQQLAEGVVGGMGRGRSRQNPVSRPGVSPGASFQWGSA